MSRDRSFLYESDGPVAEANLQIQSPIASCRCFWALDGVETSIRSRLSDSFSTVKQPIIDSRSEFRQQCRSHPHERPRARAVAIRGSTNPDFTPSVPLGRSGMGRCRPQSSRHGPLGARSPTRSSKRPFARSTGFAAFIFSIVSGVDRVDVSSPPSAKTIQTTGMFFTVQKL